MKSSPVPPVCVVYGADAFLRQLALARLRGTLTSDDVDLVRLEGGQIAWRDLSDELSSRSLFGGDQRVIMVLDADSFVTQNRSRLEDYVAAPAKGTTLVLITDSWPATTRLYKAVAATGLPIDCGLPTRGTRGGAVDTTAVVQWLGHWAKDRHGLKLDRTLGNYLWELAGPQLGRLDQELAKLALFADEKGTISQQLITDVVGGWRTKSTWELLDAVQAGNAAEALQQLERLLIAGENPQALFGAFSWSLRRFAAATRLVQLAERQGERVDLRESLRQAGFRNFPSELEKAERQLRAIGRERGAQLNQWLLDADLKLKGSHAAPARARQVLESLILRLATQLRPAVVRS
ncbi:MAG: DNA polymerase III subunit delta [Pirellulaceae bacterium]